MSKATIKDVAEHAGVSVKTVSRVINNEPNVRDVLKKKVEASVKTLNFKRNPLARGLRGQYSYILTLVYSNPNPSYILELQNGALAQCSKEGYNLQIMPCDHNDEKLLEHLEIMASNSSQDGFLLTHPICDNPQVRELFDSRGIPFSRISTFRHDHPTPWVVSNDFKAAQEMTQYLISLGHTRIAFIKGHPEFGATEKRFAGFMAAMQENGLNVRDSDIREGKFTFESGESCARQLLGQAERPTAIFASNDYMAAGVMKVAGQMKLSVPSQLSVVGYDDTPVSKQLWPDLTTVRQPIKEMATAAVSKVIRHIKKEPFDHIQSEFECEIIIRSSSSPCF